MTAAGQLSALFLFLLAHYAAPRRPIYFVSARKIVEVCVGRDAFFPETRTKRRGWRLEGARHFEIKICPCDRPMLVSHRFRTQRVHGVFLLQGLRGIVFFPSHFISHWHLLGARINRLEATAIPGDGAHATVNHRGTSNVAYADYCRTYRKLRAFVDARAALA